jgi:hypothetical protein
MKPRPTALVIPDGSARYWSTEIEERGLHHFRFPPYDVAMGVALATAPAFMALEEGQQLTPAKMAQLSPYMAAQVGICWWHRGFALEAEMPEEWTKESARRYGRSVVSEMQEEGYTLLDIMDLFSAVQSEVAKRIDVLEMAKARADFSVPPGDGLPVS